MSRAVCVHGTPLGDYCPWCRDENAIERQLRQVTSDARTRIENETAARIAAWLRRKAEWVSTDTLSDGIVRGDWRQP